MTITLKRNKIQFESMESCGCGNSHTTAAYLEWVAAATLAIENAGYTAEVKIGYENDLHKRRLYVDDDGVVWTMRRNAQYKTEIHCITEGYYDSKPSPTIVAAIELAEQIDDCALNAALTAYRADCSELTKASNKPPF
jgi:hypothetical protein